MTNAAAARTLEQRIRDTRKRLEDDVDTWVSTASDTGTPYLVPLSFLWDGTSVVISTVRTSPTSRNLLAGGSVRLAFGATRDVILVEGEAVPIEQDALDKKLADAFAAKTGFDPREETEPYQYFRIRPRRVQAWREVNELAGRTLMKDGEWLAAKPR
ncbi:pyridoxamine 5'-phosphate oxidase family protein [Streptomyces sp. CBMA152]|uniref:pyridoxamine 5'-phosphate oxidase family protein n=1 Tax=Streptomyces sp. CBMA152 TaxID=1896312 RepID=UPI001660E7F3|nr:pyridoxamine 5'-phosphate oxidase family protein [Streptomyces sp. CBMA152]MBD0744109.1 pyridoxamine 5'-phosphate oxidase [Streptomyces sp. CBMA152]